MPISRRQFTGAVLAMPALGLLPGCATSLNALSDKDIAALRISEVKITYAPDASIVWPGGEAKYLEGLPAAAKPKPSAGYVDPNKHTTGSIERHLVETPEAKAFLQQRLAGLIKARLEQRIVPQFKGTRNARLEIHVINFLVPSAAMRVIIGGHPTLGALATLRDPVTGAELAKLDRMAVAQAGNGLIGVAIDQAFSDLEDRVLDQYAANIESWLLKKA